MNTGGVRNPGFVRPVDAGAAGAAAPPYPYDLTYGDAFTVQPFGNTLVTMTLTAQQIRDLLEQQFAGCHGQAATRVLQVSNGLRVAWTPDGGCGSRIRSVTLAPMDLVADPAAPHPVGPQRVLVSDGVVPSPTATYRVAVNGFLADGGDGFSLFAAGTDRRAGPQDIDALVAYLRAFKAPAAAYDPGSPSLNKPRLSAPARSR